MQWGTTPLIEASAAGHTETVKVLLAKGADIHYQKRVISTAFQYDVYTIATHIVAFTPKKLIGTS